VNGKSIELLAPAKNLACGLAAIECGADSVYIGAERFGARQAAANSREDIARLISRAHLFRAKVYVAVNTILRDAELEDARRLVGQLHDDGVDGVIVQDFAFLELDLPPVPLIASTQMHNLTPERVSFLQDLGFKRAILARELSLVEIRRIAAAAPGIELEFFVHGALCVSYSGRCYLSYARGGRSANRGECAQPCRKPYEVRDGSGRIVAENCHALCLKDSNLSARLRELLRAGITSFKIEGRLKDEDYVRNTVLFYRRALDELLSGGEARKASSGAVAADFTPDPGKTFNRGYTTYFLQGRDAAMHCHAAPAFMGEPAGMVREVHGTRLEIQEQVALNPGDGLCFFDQKAALRGTAVNQAEGGRIWVEDPAGIAPGTSLFRNHDRLWLKALASARVERRLRVALELFRTQGGLKLKLKDEDGIEACATAQCAVACPKNADLAAQTLKRQLAKLGGTPFEAGDVTLPVPPVFVPVAALNSLRRKAVEALTAARLRSYARERRQPMTTPAKHPETNLGFEANVLNRTAEKFLRAHGVTTVAPALETGPVPAGTRVMTCKYCLRRALQACGQGRPLAPLFLHDAKGGRLRLEFDCGRCLMGVYVEK